MRHDRGALGHDGGQAARVIEVMVRQDRVADRLVRDHPLRLGDDRQRPRFVLRAALEQHDVILELHRQRVVRAVDAVHAVRELLGRRARGRRRRTRRRAAPPRRRPPGA